MSGFSQTLMRLRELSGESQDQVAEAVDVSRVAYTRYENGTREPKASIAIKLAHHFGISVEQLFSNEDSAPFPTRIVDAQLHLSEHEKNIIMGYRMAPSGKQEAICDILHIDRQAMQKAN